MNLSVSDIHFIDVDHSGAHGTERLIIIQLSEAHARTRGIF